MFMCNSKALEGMWCSTNSWCDFVVPSRHLLHSGAPHPRCTLTVRGIDRTNRWNMRNVCILLVRCCDAFTCGSGGEARGDGASRTPRTPRTNPHQLVLTLHADHLAVLGLPDLAAAADVLGPGLDPHPCADLTDQSHVSSRFMLQHPPRGRPTRITHDPGVRRQQQLLLAPAASVTPPTDLSHPKQSMPTPSAVRSDHRLYIWFRPDSQLLPTAAPLHPPLWASGAGDVAVFYARLQDRSGCSTCFLRSQCLGPVGNIRATRRNH